MLPPAKKVKKAIIGVKVIDLDVIRKGIISGVCMLNMKSPSITIQKFWLRLNLRKHRQTEMNRQTEKNNIPPILSMQGHKNK